MQNWIDKLAQTQHNLEEFQLWKNIYPTTDDDNYNLVKLFQNNKDIKVLVIHNICMSEESFRAIADNCRKLEELKIIFPTSEQNSYDRYFIN